MQVEKPYQSVQGMLLYLKTVGQSEEGGLSKNKLLNFGYSTHMNYWSIIVSIEW